MKHFKNEELKTLKQCSDEEKLCIVKAFCEGRVQEHAIGTTGVWDEDFAWMHPHSVYRVPPTETKVFWDRAPEWARYLATGLGRAFFFSQSRPRLEGDYYLIAGIGRYSYFDEQLINAFCELGDEELPLLIERPEE